IRLISLTDLKGREGDGIAKSNVTIGMTIKKKFFLTLFGGLLFLAILIGTISFTGTIFAVPLGGVGDFYVTFDELKEKRFELTPHIGETDDADEGPLARTRIDTATMDKLHISKRLQMPTGGWVRVNVTASEPTEIEGLIQDAPFIDANLMFDDMAI